MIKPSIRCGHCLELMNLDSSHRRRELYDNAVYGQTLRRIETWCSMVVTNYDNISAYSDGHTWMPEAFGYNSDCSKLLLKTANHIFYVWVKKREMVS